MTKLPLTSITSKNRENIKLMFSNYGIYLPDDKQFWCDFDKWVTDHMQTLFTSYIRYLQSKGGQIAVDKDEEETVINKKRHISFFKEEKVYMQ